MYVDRLLLNEFRAIARSEIEFIHPMSSGAENRELRNINLLVGTNGGGKSTVLKAIAAAVLGDVVDLGFLTGGSVDDWPRIGGKGLCYADVTYRSNSDPAMASSASWQVSQGRLQIDSGGVSHSGPGVAADGDDEPVRLFGYGTLRLSAQEGNAADALDPTSQVANLFEKREHLYAPEPWLSDVDAPTLEWINALMPPDTRLTGTVKDGQIEVENRGLEVVRGMLSDGIQSYMAWTLDLIFRLRQLDGTDFRQARATVLVDEVDQRMHPRWQQSVLQRLADGLPSVQFICSAHSPLLAGGLRPENLTVLEPDYDAPGEGAMKASHLEEDIYGKTSDGVLTSSYFNLASSRSEQFRQQLRSLADSARTVDTAAIDFIRMLTAGSSDEIRVRSEMIERPDRLRRRRQ